jgi:polysaccharide biosynthesis/export protein
MKKIIKVLIFTLIVSSCVPKRNINYLQNIDKSLIKLETFETKLKPEDLLKIEIRTLDKDINELYNASNNQISPDFSGYLINKDGFITLPQIGDVKAAGMSKEEFKISLHKILSKTLKNFTIDVRILNFTINIIGEVNSPGAYKVSGERINLLEALTKAGDLTIFGNRKNIKILRNIDNNLITKTIDITKSDFISSDFYYLTQNDIVIIEPRRSKADGTAIGSNISTTVSILSSLVSLYIFYLASNR